MPTSSAADRRTYSGTLVHAVDLTWEQKAMKEDLGPISFGYPQK
jgi:hypothetical protein